MQNKIENKIDTRKKLVRILMEVENNDYKDIVKNNISQLPEIIGGKIGSDDVETMTMIGFLANNSYITINRNEGIKLTNDGETRAAIKAMIDTYKQTEKLG